MKPLKKAKLSCANGIKICANTDYNMADGILILNDDCFLELFKYLSLIELANFKETYQSLAAVADMEFCRKTRGSFDFRNQKNMDDALRITKQFGSSMSRLVISYWNFGKTKTRWCEIFSVIGEQCKENLKSLSLNGNTVGLITEADVLPAFEVLKNIETIEMENYCYKNATEFLTILSQCEKAASMRLCSVIDVVDMPTNIFQKNKNLLTLEMNGVVKDCDLQRVVKNLKETRLEELLLVIKRTDSIDKEFSKLRRLNYLKRLSIQCDHSVVDSFLRKVDDFKSLTVLSLSFTMLDEASIATLGRITRLKFLQLIDCRFPTSSHFHSLLILCGNSNLEHLRFLCYTIYRHVIDTVKFLKLIEQRKRSAAENCLQLTLCQSVYTASLEAIPCELLEANKETLQLIDSYDRSYEYYCPQ